MKNQTSLLRWASLCAFVLAVTVSFGLAAGGMAATDKVKKPGRADVVIIDAMAADKKLELPPVTFLHDQHTRAMAAQQKDCATCHKPAEKGPDGAYSFAFMGADKVKGDALKDLFHKNCIGCHAALARESKKTGPLEAECRRCHTRPDVADERQDIGFDKVLHFKHTATSAIPPKDDPKKNCAACHHVYDSATQKLVWGKDKEDSCRACHMIPADRDKALKKNPLAKDDQGELAKRPTLPDAAHAACVNCHQSIAAKKQADIKTGPVECAGCHSIEAQAKLKAELGNDLVAGSIPRLERGQPDAVLLLPVPGKKDAEVAGTMRPVSFNHKLHEAKNADCRTCHHKKIAACGECHTLEGKAEGGFVNLAQAMHKVDSARSCVGCHNAQTMKPSCAGCHSTMPKELPKDSCGQCHTAPQGVAPEKAEDGSLMKLGKEERAGLAAAEVARRDARAAQVIEDKDIPETVTIGLLSNEYEPAKLPHRKIVKALMARQSNSTLAKAFHADPTTLCQGCHHNSPATKTPPKCASCHAADVAPGAPGNRPALKAAYHLQCMTCHARMDQKPAQTECADCHKPRANK